MKKYQVAVLGGGFAGACAALAAAEEGASVLLIEKGNCLGGAAVHCLVNPFMPYSTKIDGKKTDLSAGAFRRIVDRLTERGAMKGPEFLEEELKFVLENMLLDAGVDFLYRATLAGVNRSEERITSLSLATRGGLMTVEADCFVDATGDALLTEMAGCPTVLGRDPDRLCQPMTLCFRLGNVDVERFFASRARLDAAHKQAHANGELINPREDILIFKTPIPNVLHFNTTRVVKHDPTSPEDVTAAEILARRQVFEIYEFMKKHADGLENSFLMMTAAEIGVRESRMAVGDYVLTETDCRACTKFEDAIAACNYDIDIHNPEGSGTSHYYFPEGAYYTIPYRSLIPKNAENLLVAGRCISSDHGAQASYRIMPTVATIGEAAGVAAALATRTDAAVRTVDVPELQGILRRRGAFLGI